jgi:hypothetical protein
MAREMRQYLRDFNRLNTATTTARELYDGMLEIYPDRVNPGSLWSATNRQEAAMRLTATLTSGCSSRAAPLPVASSANVVRTS